MFRRKWREVANAAGIPPHVQNRDARAGGITEGRKVGVPTDDNMKHAGHTDRRTHERVYNRESLEQTRRVAQLRQEYRRTNRKGRTRDA